jgi:hypothetical protein
MYPGFNPLEIETYEELSKVMVKKVGELLQRCYDEDSIMRGSSWPISVGSLPFLNKVARDILFPWIGTPQGQKFFLNNTYVQEYMYSSKEGYQQGDFLTAENAPLCENMTFSPTGLPSSAPTSQPSSKPTEITTPRPTGLPTRPDYQSLGSGGSEGRFGVGEGLGVGAGALALAALVIKFLMKKFHITAPEQVRNNRIEGGSSELEMRFPRDPEAYTLAVQSSGSSTDIDVFINPILEEDSQLEEGTSPATPKANLAAPSARGVAPPPPRLPGRFE